MATRQQTQRWLDTITAKPELTGAEKDAVAELVGHPGMEALLATLLAEREGWLLQLSRAPLADEAGRWRASVLQGTVQGIDRIGQALIDLLPESPTDEGT